MAKKSKKNELDELDCAYTDLTGGPVKQRKRLPVAIWITVAALLLVAGLGIYFSCFGSLFDDFLTMPDVTVAGVPLGGMTKAQAKEAVLQATKDTYTKTAMVVRVLDATVELTPEETGITPDMGAAVNAAFWQRPSGAFDLTPYLNMDLEKVNAAAQALGKQFNTDLSQTTYTVEGTPPSLALGDEDDDSGKMVLTVTKGSPEYGLVVEQLYTQILSVYSENRFFTEGKCSIIEPQAPNFAALYETHCIAPVDAVMDSKTFEITPETYGYGFDPESAVQDYSEVAYGHVLTIPFERITPAVTAEALAATLYQDVLGACKTPYSGRDGNNRNTNLRLACEAINGFILLPGETFTYNYTLGERTAARGYKPAASYVNGKTVDTYGGGICQVSTTLYYCTLIADLEIVERWPHGYVPAYIEWGMDASVSWNSGDFRFKNNTNWPIRIEAYRADGYVYVQLLGTDEKDYYVKMHSETVGSTPWKEVYQEMAPDNKEGYKDGQVIITPYTGYKVNAYKCKYDKQTDALISKELESVNNYSHRDKLICKIVDPNAPAETTAATVPSVG